MSKNKSISHINSDNFEALHIPSRKTTGISRKTAERAGKDTPPRGPIAVDADASATSGTPSTPSKPLSATSESPAETSNTPHQGFVKKGQARRRYRLLALSLILVASTIILWWLEVATGDTWYTPSEIWGVIRGDNVPGASFAVGELRLPRAIVALLVGLALGMAGRTSQTLLRNDLASPDIIGITSGASASAVIAILVCGWSGLAVNAIALISGLAVALLIFALAGKGGAQSGRLILIGIGFSAIAMSITHYAILRANIYKISDALRWLSGSLSRADWDQVPILILSVSVLGCVLLFHEHSLRALRLGDEAAVGLGVPVKRTRLVVLLCVVGLSSFAAAATGPIAFVAFLAGPVTARLAGPQDNTLLAPSALMGAVLVLGADLLGQHAFPTVLPVAVVTGIVGAPYLLLSLLRMNKSGASA